MTDDDPHLLLGAYILGGLDSIDRAAFEMHLTGCDRCRAELTASAGLPALLRLTSPGRTGSAPRPAQHLVRRVRLRRRRRVAVLATVGAVAAVAIFAAIALRPATPAVDVRLTATGSTAVQGTASFEAKAWGTAIDLDLQHLPQHATYVLRVEARDGREEQAAVWHGTGTPAVAVTAATSIPERDIVRLAIETAGDTQRIVAGGTAERQSGNQEAG